MTEIQTVNGQVIKPPTTVEIQRYKMTKSGRLSSGLMTMDLVAKKRKFCTTYESISGRELQNLLTIIDGDDIFMPLNYVEDGISKSAIVYVGNLNTLVARSTASATYYKDFPVDYIEQ